MSYINMNTVFASLDARKAQSPQRSHNSLINQHQGITIMNNSISQTVLYWLYAIAIVVVWLTA